MRLRGSKYPLENNCLMERGASLSLIIKRRIVLDRFPDRNFLSTYLATFLIFSLIHVYLDDNIIFFCLQAFLPLVETFKSY